MLRSLLVVVVVTAVGGCRREQKITPTRLTLGITAEPTSLVPMFGSSTADAEAGGLLFRELVARTANGVVADLAVRVPTLGDGAVVDGDRLVVSWSLKADVRWSDGTPVTSADIVAGWKVALDDAQPVTTGRELANDVERIDVVDATHFRVVWRRPQPSFAAPRVHRVLPAHLVLDESGAVKPLASYLRRPVGNGPFVIAEDVAGAHLLLRKRADVATGVDEVLVRYLSSTESLTSALLANDIDCTFQNAGLSPTEAARLVAEHPGRFTVARAPGNTWVHLDFNLDDPVLGDLRIRQAIAAAIDREKLIAAVANDAYDVDEGFLPRMHAAYMSRPHLAVEPARSERLLDEAGFKRPAPGAVRVDKTGAALRLQIAAASGQRDTERLLTLVQSALREVGIDVTLELRPFKVFFAEGARKRALPHMAFYAWSIDVDSVGGSLWRADRIPSPGNNYSGQNFPGWRNAELTADLLAADNSLDENLRRLTAKRANALLLEELPALSFYFRPAVVVCRAGVTGVVPTGTLTPMAVSAAAWRAAPTTTP